MTIEVIYAAILTFAFWLPTTPSSMALIINCLDRNELFFEFDYFTPGGYDRTPTHCDFDGFPVAWYACRFTLLVGTFACSNIIEAVLTTKVLLYMKRQTSKSAYMLTRKDLRRRQRYHNI